MKPVTAGQALVELLADHGVDTVFGIPGTHSIELYRGLASERIRHISPRHEQGGGFMADGYARASGRPGVCFVITGPGVTNLATPMAGAYIDSVPMLVISPVNPPDPHGINRGRLHELSSQEAVSRPFCADSVTVESADQIPEAVNRAFSLFASQRPRPVHINIPLPVLVEPVGEPWHALSCTTAMAKVSDRLVAEAARKIGRARHKVLVVGGGTVDGQSDILALAERMNCPVITTVAARGVIPAGHPLSVGAQLRAPRIQKVLQEADLALFLGTDFAQTDHWNDDMPLPCEQIWVNLSPDSMDSRTSALTAVGDCLHFARKLHALLPEPSREAVDRCRMQCLDLRTGRAESMTDKEKMHWAVLEIIDSHLQKGMLVASDMTQSAYTAVDYLPAYRPRQWLHPVGYGPLGYALPAAIGALLSDAADTALAIVGDAGFQYTQQEMGLAAELGLNLTVLLWNNHALQQICDDMDSAGIEPVGVVQKNPDFLALAEAYGWRAWKNVDITSLESELAKASETPGPVLIEIDESLVRTQSGQSGNRR
ncbi:MAG: 5-guanidino-2-oxopentanoate decarboxylase [Gammaproteobacteria bacterium]|nr:5-guanidino-2-oxopentanoate decarboxylase [Gammaproteobacteria bacterium]MYD76035.1 5-guanidino-2-oxopentanoate decarboxylase [Gammaproteobacteria bacterium]MYJ53257.1 5-guanidino-2-oxopentanoate decarboxylase [Gammaproteobacteria bacterium]